MSDPLYIVGLGNPGSKYRTTRHNLGFLVLEKLAEDFKLKFQSCSFTKAYLAEGSDGGKDFVLFLPMTYVNASGDAVKSLVELKKIQTDRLLVVCDDLNLEFGQIRARTKGSDGGHNGLSSIIERLGTDRFPRLRMGIGQPKKGMDTADFVLEDFNAQEKAALKDFILKAADCCLSCLKTGMEQAMQTFNQK